MLHDRIALGDVIVAGQPSGEFVPPENDSPVILISAGIGVTPRVSMLHILAGTDRPVVFLHGARDGRHAPLVQEVRDLVVDSDNVSLGVFFSQPGKQDALGEHYEHAGRIGATAVRKFSPGMDAEFFLFGPAGFLADIAQQLVDDGVPADRIHVETF